MRNLFLLSLSLLLFAACDESSDGAEAPPTELVGTWRSDNMAIGGNAAVDSFADPAANPCEGMNFDPKGVDSGLLKVDNNGLVYDGTQITNVNQPYRVIGTVNSAGRFVPMPGTEDEYLGYFGGINWGAATSGFSFAGPGFTMPGLPAGHQPSNGTDVGSQVSQGVMIDLTFEEDAFKGPRIIMDIKMLISVQGMTQSMDIEQRVYYKVSDLVEKNLINNAFLCFQKSTFNNP